MSLTPQNFKNVLIVDDNPNIRAALRSFLTSRMDVEFCCEAGNGVEAVEVAIQQKPNLVLMDLSMPIMNGAEASATIRKALPKSRIIMFTLFPDRFGKSMAKAVGVDLVVDKREGSAGLVRALEGLLAS